MKRLHVIDSHTGGEPTRLVMSGFPELSGNDMAEKRDALRNRVMLLDPEAADPDLASELVRDQLGVMREDEVVITLED